ncbi:hypothetical protein [Streptomyces lomondensis]|uniref:Guanylate cyclase domain-containing protein n=1 Tax=Streptomyces lomondensis TaxID=68229 RepID=A0ABQ2WZ92_9ACTN|nr:hypothetical protein [Streptomyces lomondensis]MCF0076748.1 hypothetical protein [Streptomyces lomondensis]GGW83925.1 hypothetical protein GCM10010383_10900 [Streptomyces lomondensis]
MEAEDEYNVIISVDAEGSGRLTDPEKDRMRARLYEVTGQAFEKAGLRPPRLYQEDRGDGVLSFVPTCVRRRVVGEWLEYLHQNLREVNRDLRTPLRLRVGMHIGPVRADAHGRSGRAVDLACRLCDCATAKAVLAAAPQKSPLVAVVSDRLHEEAVLSGGRWVEPDHYRRYDVELKEGGSSAWFIVPGLPQPPEPEPADETDGPGGREDTPSGPGGTPAPRDPAAAPKGPAAQHAKVVQEVHQHGNGQLWSGNFENINIGRPGTGGSDR